MEYFGYSTFRNDQLSIITSIQKKNDTVALLPTGGGKSLCYQFPTLFLKLKTIVISPLLALMEDQVKSAQNLNIPAWSVSSSFSNEENNKSLSEFIDGAFGILFISPERLNSENFMKRIEMVPIDLVAVDEAHCISKWGFDFRPGYRKIARLKKIAPHASWLVLTATATEKVLDDVVQVLELKDPNVIRQSFARKNIEFQVVTSNKPNEILIKEIQDSSGSVIVYCRNRMKTEDVAALLQSKNIHTKAYHAGMSSDVRKIVADSWMDDDFRIIISTNAFGMGIDKSNVRKVIHLDIPPSIEEYYQEAGRAGRDGKSSKAVILISENEGKRSLSKSHKYIISQEQLREIMDFLNDYVEISGNNLISNPIYTLKEKTKIHPIKIIQGIKILEQEGFVSVSEGIKNPSRIRFEKSMAQHSIFGESQKPTYQLADYCLKRYENLFNSWVIIDEFEISIEFQTNPSEIFTMLKSLEKEGVLKYLPAKGSHEITVLKPIQLNEDVSFRFDYQFTKQDQLINVINYCDSKTCRVQFILKYFNENSNPCGMCDVCKADGKPNNLSTFDDYLNDMLQEDEKLIKDLLDNPYLSKEKTIQRLQYLAIERQIKIIGHKIVKN